MENIRTSRNKSLISSDDGYSNNRALSTQVTNYAVQDEDVIDPFSLWRVIRRYKELIIGMTLTASLIALLISLMLRPEFTATATVGVNEDTSISAGTGEGRSRAWSNRINTETIMELMKSRTFAKVVIDNLGYARLPEFTGELRQRSFVPDFGKLKKNVMSLFNKPKETSTKTLNEYATSRFASKIRIEKIDGTKLLRVSYTSFSPEVSSVIVNATVEAYNQYNARRLKELSNSALVLLKTELDAVQKKLKLSELKLNQFARKTGIVDLENKNSLINSRANSLSQEYISAQNQRMKLEIQIESARQAGSLLTVPFIKTEPSIIELQSQLSALEAERSEMASIFKENYPKLKVLNRKIGLVKQQINEEAKLIFKGLVTQFKNARQSERVLIKEIEQSNTQLLDIKDRSITFNILKREWQGNLKLYEGLLEKVKLAGVSSKLEMNQLSLMDSSKSASKSFPNTKKYVVLAGSGAFLVALALAFLFNLLDRRFRSVQELEEITGLPVLSLIPKVESGDDGHKLTKNDISMMTYNEPSGVIGETFRSLRTSLTYSLPDSQIGALMITSAGPSEGKSTTIFNLAITLANSGLKVVLIDADLRKPSVHKIIDKSRSPGLTDALVTGKIPIRNININNLSIISAGTASPNPTEMLDSESFRTMTSHLKQEYDVVLFDSPPIIGLADALVLSQNVDHVIMAVDLDMTNKDTIRSSLKRMARVNSSLLGTVVTKYEASHFEDYDYTNSSYYYYYGSDEGHGEKIESGSAVEFKTVKSEHHD